MTRHITLLPISNLSLFDRSNPNFCLLVFVFLHKDKVNEKLA
jgi:hypothetical protein